MPPPWTADPIIDHHRFTNAYRAADRVSQHLIRHVIYGGEQREDEIVFRTLLFKLFNRIETWELLEASFGRLSLEAFSAERYCKPLDMAFARGDRVYSAAYIMPSARCFGAERKHANHLRLLEAMVRDRIWRQLARCSSLQEVFALLRSYPSFGDFLAFQLSIDLNYSDVLPFSEMDFVVPGPGALEGIRKCFSDLGGMDPTMVIRWVAETQADHLDRLGLNFRSLWGRPLQLVDCQNLFCETAKYARVAHPEATPAGGRTRIKQRFEPSPRDLRPWFPPRWHLNDQVSAHESTGAAKGEVAAVRSVQVPSALSSSPAYQVPIGL